MKKITRLNILVRDVLLRGRDNIVQAQRVKRTRSIYAGA